MSNVRLIARLDVKAPNLVKGIQLEGLRQLGDPHAFARRYYEAGIDEILYMDIVASLYERNSILDLVERTTADVFVPLTVGGGIRSVGDAGRALQSGADKVAINTAAIKRPELITETAQHFGSQCMVLSIEAKRTGEGAWEAYYDNGREKTGIDAIGWAKRGQEMGAGEILLTSVDREGMARGMDVELISAITRQVSIPVIASGGMGKIEHLAAAVKKGRSQAVAMAHVLHYDKIPLAEIRSQARDRGIEVRP
ncbi:MAG: imidazole glycerol phosphate synthase subunit HisF [Magnetococcales bacterium]|nr:imidazole glycerol phosphate synthase subunit HisF [Magnetococcales bacterium]